MNDTDQETIGAQRGEEEPIRSASPDELDMMIDGAEALGAARVTDTDKTGGVRALTLDAEFSTASVHIANVDERLEEGTYALVRVTDK